MLLHLDHIVPWKLWKGSAAGYKDPENLACACIHCNSIKQHRMRGFDRLTGAHWPLFNPREDGDAWANHFAWSAEYTEIVPVSAVGRATMAVLRMNRAVYKEHRRLLVDAWRGGGQPWP